MDQRFYHQQKQVLNRLQALYKDQLQIRKRLAPISKKAQPPSGKQLLSPIPDKRLHQKQLSSSVRFNCYRDDSPRIFIRSVYNRQAQIRRSSLKKVKPKLIVKQQGKQQRQKKLIPQRQLLMRISLAHGFFNIYQHKSRRLILGKGNHSSLVRSIFLKRGYWKIDTFKGFNAQGQVMITGSQGKGNTVILNENIDLLWTQRQQYSFLLNLDKQFKPVINLPRITPISVAKHLALLFSDQDIAFSDNLIHLSAGPVQGFLSRVKQNLKSTNISVLQQVYPLHNHLKSGSWLGDKKNLLLCLREFCEQMGIQFTKIMPQTYLLQQQKRQQPSNKQKQNWIYKPGQNSNRGNGISLFLTYNQAINQYQKQQNNSAIIQKYIQQPLLYKGRKFDIRCFAIVSNLHNILRVYWFNQGYIRTSSSIFSLDLKDKFIHLTNDAIQSRSKKYGQFQTSNKISFRQIQSYFHSQQIKLSFLQDICPKLKKLTKIAFAAALPQLKKQKSKHQFQLFGLDFMLDNKIKPFLIQVNTNPCLSTSCPLLQKVIGGVLDKLLQVAVDPLFGPGRINRIQSFLNIQGLQLLIDQKDQGWKGQKSLQL